MGNYSSRHSKPLGASDNAMGGAAENLSIEALFGETDMVTVFDDFNDVIPNTALAVVAGDSTTGPWSDAGWVTTEDAGVTAVADTIGMNDPVDVSEGFQSSIRFFPGTADDTGGNMQLDLINADLASGANHLTALSSRRHFPHIWIPRNTTATILDNIDLVFGCRIGLQSGETTDGDWEGKVFIGWAEAGDTSIMTHDDGVITITSDGPLVGFHIPEDGSIRGISHRTVATAMAEGTNFTEISAAGAVDGTTANGANSIGDVMWFDLALRMTITNMSDDSGNGTTEFYHRRVPKTTGTPGSRGHDIGGEGMAKWTKHSVVLEDQTPNNNVALVPTIEVLNGVTGGDDIIFFLDWWTFGMSRFSRK